MNFHPDMTADERARLTVEVEKTGGVAISAALMERYPVFGWPMGWSIMVELPNHDYAEARTHADIRPQ